METILDSLQTSPVAVLSPDDLQNLLDNGKILRETDTSLRDMIRIIDWKGELLIQEKTDQDEFILRKAGSREQADEFIKKRIEAYDRMWDG